MVGITFGDVLFYGGIFGLKATGLLSPEHRTQNTELRMWSRHLRRKLRRVDFFLGFTWGINLLLLVVGFWGFIRCDSSLSLLFDFYCFG